MFNGNDLELLSAYLDSALSDEERAALEARLQTDADLRRELDRLRATVALIKTLPTLSAPRPLTLTPRMVRRPNILTSAAFSALSAAAAIVLLVLGAALFITRPAAAPAVRLVAGLPTGQFQTESQAVNEPQAAEANNAVQPPVAADNLQVTLAKSTTQVGQEASGALDFAAVPTGTPQPNAAAPLLYAAAPPSETLAPEELQADGSVVAQSQQSQPSPSDQQTQARQVAPSAAMGGMASAAQAPLPAPTLALPTETLVPTETATSTPTETSTATDTATLTSTLSPTPSAVPTLVPTPVPTVADSFALDGYTGGVVLIIIALAFLAIAVVTTILRRRS